MQHLFPEAPLHIRVCFKAPSSDIINRSSALRIPTPSMYTPSWNPPPSRRNTSLISWDNPSSPLHLIAGRHGKGVPAQLTAKGFFQLQKRPVNCPALARANSSQHVAWQNFVRVHADLPSLINRRTPGRLAAQSLPVRRANARQMVHRHNRVSVANCDRISVLSSATHLLDKVTINTSHHNFFLTAPLLSVARGAFVQQLWIMLHAFQKLGQRRTGHIRISSQVGQPLWRHRNLTKYLSKIHVFFMFVLRLIVMCLSKAHVFLICVCFVTLSMFLCFSMFQTPWQCQCTQASDLALSLRIP